MEKGQKPLIKTEVGTNKFPFRSCCSVIAASLIAQGFLFPDKVLQLSASTNVFQCPFLALCPPLTMGLAGHRHLPKFHGYCHACYGFTSSLSPTIENWIDPFKKNVDFCFGIWGPPAWVISGGINFLPCYGFPGLCTSHKRIVVEMLLLPLSQVKESEQLSSYLRSRPRGSAYAHSLLQPYVPEVCYHIFHLHTADLRLAKHELQSVNVCSLGTVSQWPQTETWCFPLCFPLCSANIKGRQDWSPRQKHFLIIHVHMKVLLFCRTYAYKLYQPI